MTVTVLSPKAMQSARRDAERIAIYPGQHIPMRVTPRGVDAPPVYLVWEVVAEGEVRLW